MSPQNGGRIRNRKTEVEDGDLPPWPILCGVPPGEECEVTAAGIPVEGDRLSTEVGTSDRKARWWYSIILLAMPLTQWFSYRRRDRSRPIIGDRRSPSLLGDIQPASKLAEYTTELNVLGLLVKL